MARGLDVAVSPPDRPGGGETRGWSLGLPALRARAVPAPCQGRLSWRRPGAGGPDTAHRPPEGRGPPPADGDSRASEALTPPPRGPRATRSVGAACGGTHQRLLLVPPGAQRPGPRRTDQQLRVYAPTLTPRGVRVPWGQALPARPAVFPRPAVSGRALNRACRQGLALTASSNVPLLASLPGLTLRRVIILITALAPALRRSSPVTFKGNSGTFVA